MSTHTEAIPVPELPAGRIRRLLPGTLTAIGVGALAWFVSRFTPAMSPLIWAILLGALAANTLKLPAILAPGITFSAKQILRLAVGLLGLRLAVSQVLAVGPSGLVLVVVAVAATFFFSQWIGKRLGLSRSLSTVLSAGTSICGASAIVAVAGIADAKDEETAIGVGAVTVYGTLAMFLYPLIAQLTGMTPEVFGLWAGASIHEVAQVVAAGFSFDSAAGGGTDAVELATVVKLGRVLMLAPVTILLSLSYRSAKRSAGAAKVSPVPWFIVVFILMVAVRSLDVLPAPVLDGLIQFDGLLLAVSMAGLGLDLRWARVRAAGLKPLYATLAGTVFIAVVSLGVVKAFGTLT